MNTKVIENKIVFFMKVPSNKVNGGIEEYCRRIYKNNNYTNFIELHNSKYFTKGFYEYSMRNEVDSAPNVDYIDVKDKSVVLKNCKVFIHWSDQYKDVKKVKFENSDLHIIDHGVCFPSILKRSLSSHFFTKYRNLIHRFFVRPFTFFKPNELKNITLITNTVEEIKEYKKSRKYVFKDIINIELLHIGSAHLARTFDKDGPIVFLGRNTVVKFWPFADQKNIRGLLKVNNKIDDSNKKIKFYSSKTTGTPEFIKSYTGFKEAQEILKQAKYLVLYSWYEGMGMVLLEALSVGTPILISDRLQAGKWIVGNAKEQTGLIFDINNHKQLANWINENFDNEDIWNKLHNNANKAMSTRLNPRIFDDKWTNLLKK